MHSPPTSRFSALLAVCLFAGCPRPEPDEEPEDLATTLPELGTYGVGYRETEVTYDPGDGPRTLRVAIWYPSPTTTGPEFRYLGAFPAPGVYDQTEVASGSFPLVVYSHGSRGYAEASGRLMRHLASHGTIIVAPDHTGNTSFDSPDRPTEIFWHRPRDISAVIDLMTGPDPLADSLTNDPIVAVGHSFGGYTAHALAGARYDTPTLFEGCANGTDTSDFCSTLDPTQEAIFESGLRDSRIEGILSMAPGNASLFGVAGLAQSEVPAMLMTGGFDDAEQAALHWEGLNQPGNVHVSLTDAGHNAFADFAPVLDQGDEFIDAETGWAIMSAYQLAWVRHLRGDPTVEPVVDGTLVFGDTTDVELGQN